jgi:ribosomal protein S18 acetylase RimI-like enzyme
MNSFFVPKLSNCVSINDYSEKLSEFACVYFAVYEEFDIGMVAFYLNFENKKSFITSVSVRKEFQKYGIGSALISLVENVAIAYNFDKVELEVYNNNFNAINFYYKKKFMFKMKRGKQFLLSKSIF